MFGERQNQNWILRILPVKNRLYSVKKKNKKKNADLYFEMMNKIINLSFIKFIF